MRPHRMLLQACTVVVALLVHHSLIAQPTKRELRKLDVAGHSRVYTVEALGGPARGPRPIIVELHGTGADVRESVGSRYFPNFATVANIDPVLVVRPQGANRLWDLLPGKLEGLQRLSGADGLQVDDIGFLRAVVADVVARDGGDPKHVFLYGVSFGGHMVARIACEMIGEFRALAALIASALIIQLEQCKDALPVPYMLLVSKNDQVVWYDGLKAGPTDSRAPAEEIVAHFVRRNGCRDRDERAIPAADPTDGMKAVVIRHTGCKADAEVWFYRLEGSYHTLPSRVRYESDRDDRINRDIETAQELWTFFRRFMN